MKHFCKKNVFSHFLKILMLLWVFSASYTDGASDTGKTLPHHLWSKYKKFIKNGRLASNGQFPHQVSLQSNGYPRLGSICGGVILDDLTILTAGHCVYDSTSVFKVVVGNVNLKDNSSLQKRKVEQIYIHPGYTEIQDVVEYDIALVCLKVPLEFNEFVQPIHLPDKDSYPSGDAILSGWGETSERDGSQVYPLVLHFTEVILMSPLDCSAAIEYENNFNLDTDLVLCTGHYNETVYPAHASQGDSGGGLVQNGKVVGVVSWGTDEFSVYTRVSKFVDWIIKSQESYRNSRNFNSLENESTTSVNKCVLSSNVTTNSINMSNAYTINKVKVNCTPPNGLWFVMQIFFFCHHF